MELIVDKDTLAMALFVSLIVSICKDTMFQKSTELVRKTVLPLLVLLLVLFLTVCMYLVGQVPENVVGHFSSVSVVAFAIYGIGYSNIEKVLRRKLGDNHD